MLGAAKLFGLVVLFLLFLVGYLEKNKSRCPIFDPKAVPVEK